jgi:hypothetical protein
VKVYFKGIYDWAQTHVAGGHATLRIGVYGGYDVVKYIHDRGYAAYKWQAVDCMHGKGRQSDALQQYGAVASVGGVEVDWNRVSKADYGVWFSACIVNPPKQASFEQSTKQAKPEQASAGPAGAPIGPDTMTTMQKRTPPAKADKSPPKDTFTTQDGQTKVEGLSPALQVLG